MRCLPVLAVAFTLLAAPALAFQCPMDMAAIDAALAANPTLSAEQLAEVTALRAEGESLHAAGDHDGSVAALAKAKAILGL
ncbi:hypothetical protein [Gemmobacter caeruleus]|uniref:hypothetical protein n=1 Tax=Gemmobacter caeruleus TaxID=2595004 RepID=UPI0011EF99E4|nr:hypothetical protein [Gemmobacter caeruleus]